MRYRSRVYVAVLIAALLVVQVLPLSNLVAQSSTIVLQVAVPSVIKEALTDKALEPFLNANPGVSVRVITDDTTIPSAAEGLQSHFDAMGKYASLADVLYVNSSHISEEATRAGYYLDLAPLINTDTSLQIDDFYPQIWQAFQWNKGVWAMPAAATVYMLTYDQATFDQAGLAYPSNDWTLDDLVNAVRTLAVKAPNGQVTTHGIDVFGNVSQAFLLRSLAGEGLYDASTLPNTPQLDKPVVENLLDQWNKLETDGLVGGDLNKAPLGVAPAIVALINLDPNTRRVPVMLPGGKAGLDVQGFAVSRGTQYQEKAYALATFLTTLPDLSNRFSSVPARKSMVGKEGDQQMFQLNLSPEFQATLLQGVENGIPLSEIRHSDYLALALNQMLVTRADAKTALQTAEIQAVKDQQTATDKLDTNTLVVAPPAPILAAGSGKITLKFGITSFERPLPNQDKWDKLIADFVSSDPQVGAITYESGFDMLDTAADKYDCFYLPFNGVPDADLSKILNLDPYFAADASFDKADVVGNVLTQLSRDNKVWALPLAIEPEILKYDDQKFNRASVPEPGSEWTVAQFNDAVKTLKADPKDTPPFVPSGQGGTHLFVLIAAYGGLPLDYRQNPPAINFTDPTNVAAIRQVLDLAKNGYIKYSALSSLSFGFGQATLDGAIYANALTMLSFRQAAPTTDNSTQTYKVTTYPRGTQFSAVSYNIDAAYISATSQSPDACYRWISTVAKHPELFGAMPARRSLIGTATANQGADVAALYHEIDTLLQDPNTISIPSQFGGGRSSPTSFLMQYFLYKAFDSYVLQDGDLEAGLKEAEENSKAFQTCAVDLPTLDTSSRDNIRTYIKAFGDCATKVDPSLTPLFNLINR